VCGARWAMCSCEVVCVGMARGVSRGEKNARHTRAFAAVEAASPPAASAGQPTVCVRHTARHTLWDVQLVRQGWERGGWERREPARAARAAVSSASASSCSPG
jgi:hypothetical protein